MHSIKNFACGGQGALKGTLAAQNFSVPAQKHFFSVWSHLQYNAMSLGEDNYLWILGKFLAFLCKI